MASWVQVYYELSDFVLSHTEPDAFGDMTESIAIDLPGTAQSYDLRMILRGTGPRFPGDVCLIDHATNKEFTLRLKKNGTVEAIPSQGLAQVTAQPQDFATFNGREPTGAMVLNPFQNLGPPTWADVHAEYKRLVMTRPLGQGNQGRVRYLRRPIVLGSRNDIDELYVAFYVDFQGDFLAGDVIIENNDGAIRLGHDTVPQQPIVLLQNDFNVTPADLMSYELEAEGAVISRIASKSGKPGMYPAVDPVQAMLEANPDLTAGPHMAHIGRGLVKLGQSRPRSARRLAATIMRSSPCQCSSIGSAVDELLRLDDGPSDGEFLAAAEDYRGKPVDDEGTVPDNFDLLHPDKALGAFVQAAMDGVEAPKSLDDVADELAAMGVDDRARRVQDIISGKRGWQYDPEALPVGCDIN